MKDYQMPINALDQMLNTYQVDHIKEMGKYLLTVLQESGIRPARLKVPKSPGKLPSKKADRIQWIVTAFKDRTLLEYLYKKKMNPLEQAALEEGVAESGSFNPIRFKAKYGGLPETSIPLSRYSRRYKKTPFPVIALFFRKEEMPQDLLDQLIPFVAHPKETGAQFLDQLPKTVAIHDGWDETEEVELVRHATHPAAVSDIRTLLQLTDQGKIRVGAKTGRPTKAACKTILTHLHSGDFYPEDLNPHHRYDVKIGDAGIRPFAWAMLIQAGGLAKINGSKLDLSRTGKTALKKKPQEVLKTLWERWLKNKNFHELSRVEEIKGQKSKRRPLYKAADSRHSISDALSDLKPGQWIKTDNFFTFLQAQGHEICIVRDPWPLYISDSHYGSLGYSHVNWEHLEGRFARALLLEYAATLGLIDVALIPPWNSVIDHRDLWGADEYSCLSQYDGLFAIRLTTLGVWILGLTDEYVPPVQDDILLCILANMDITAPADLPAPDRLFLDRICKQKSGKVWQLTLDTLLKAIEEGVEFKSVIDFLTQRNNGPLPGTMDVLLKEAARRTSLLENKGEARLIYCKDKALIQLIADDTVLKKICLPAGPHHVAVYMNKEKPFKTRLRKLGYVLNRG